MGIYRTYPRIVGETGNGKDFVVAHKSADVNAVVTALAERMLLNSRDRNVLLHPEPIFQATLLMKS